MRLSKFRKKNKHYDYHEDFRHTTFECRELKKALHKLSDRGQLNCSLKSRKRMARDRYEIDTKGKSDSYLNIKIITTIIDGINSREHFLFNHSKELRCLGHCTLIIYKGITCDQG